MPKGSGPGAGGPSDESRTAKYDIDRRDLLKTTGAGVIGIPGVRRATGRASAEHETIEDWHDLNAIRSRLDGENYILVADLDADTPGYEEHVGDPAGGWEPIDGFDDSTLNGNGYSISDLVIDRRNESDVGLFGDVSGGRIEDLSIRDADITGGNRVGTFIGIGNCEVVNSDATGSVSGYGRVGGIIGSAFSAEIIDSYTEQEITGSDGRVGGIVGSTDDCIVSNSYAMGPVSSGNRVGGVVGHCFDGTITESYATGPVDGTDLVGGVVGRSYVGEVENSYATGAVSGKSAVGGLVGSGQIVPITESHATGAVSGLDAVGGLVGMIDEESSVTESYATGTVGGDISVGGLVGRTQLNSTVSECYATGSVDGYDSVGGLIGSAQEIFVDTGVTQSYATGPVSGSENVGGLVGQSSYGEVTDSYWDVPATGQGESSGGGTGLGSLDNEPPAEEMTGEDAAGYMDGFDFEDTWRTQTDPDEYPELQWIETEPSVFEQLAEAKLETAAEIDDIAVSLSESDDVETVIDGIRDERYRGDLDEETANQAVTRLNWGEDISRRLLYKTSNKSRDVADDEQVAVNTTRFSIDLAVSLGVSQLALTDALTDSEVIRKKLDIALKELISYTFSRARQSEAWSEINRIVQEAYDRILADEFSDFEEFFSFVSDSVSATVANLTLMGTIETGSGFEPRIGDGFNLVNRFTNVESSLGYLNDELNADSLVNQGLDGTRQGALDARDDARNLLDEIASWTDTFLDELNNRIDIAGILENAYEIVDGIYNGRFISTVDAVTVASVFLLPKASLAVTTVQIIGQYVGELSIRLMMTTHAWGIAGVQRGDPISLADINSLEPDVNSILAELDPIENRWGEFV